MVGQYKDMYRVIVHYADGRTDYRPPIGGSFATEAEAMARASDAVTRDDVSRVDVWRGVRKLRTL